MMETGRARVCDGRADMTMEVEMGAAVEISTGTIDPVHLKGKHVMLGAESLGVLDGTRSVVRYDIPAGKHIVYLKDGLTTSGAVAFRVSSGHCAQLTIRDAEAGMFAAIFGGWVALKRSGDEHLDDQAPGAEEISVDEVPVDA
ncbi:hypothetical protein O9K63_02475 [Janibacter cremeus]|uniref:hypothetical protein n=1 Tax=Janibacter cremeus TaxID=1285192 RepID=UPI0023F86486|nr:hypothetical protein [Janibacter cremeus]WEV78684.1 hypothetical protein O9K63_02475 [Janibacter cremeus]